MNAIPQLRKYLSDLKSKLLLMLQTTYSEQNIEKKQKLFEEVFHALEVFRNYYNEISYCLPEVLCQKLQAFHTKSEDVHFLADAADLTKNPHTTKDFRMEHENDLLKAANLLDNEISPLFTEIEKDFRNLLGAE